MSLGGYPVAVDGFVVHHQEERFTLVGAPVEPFFAVLGYQVGDVPRMAYGVGLGDELRVVVVALVVENHPMVESCGLRDEVPFADYCGFVAVGLQNFGQRLLRAVETFCPVFHKTVFVAVFAGKDCRATRSGDGVAAVVVVERGTFVSDAVDVGCRRNFANRMPVDAHCLASMVVAHNEDDVRPTVLFVGLGFLSVERRYDGQ